MADEEGSEFKSGVAVDEANEFLVAEVAVTPAVSLKQPLDLHAIVYRPDIDGLRMLAVVPVLLFHAYPERFPSGFIGVDIFFVISGYLISSILFKESAKGTFTYANFYSRRVRRIYPTLLLVLSATWWLGSLYLLSTKLQAMAATMFAGTMFSANIQVMLLERGYFDDDIKENPLLHLWSLGVEEQFYIFWPCFVALLTRLPVRSAIVAHCVVLATSFGFNLALLGYNGSNKYSFYFPLCRFWQMGVGGLLAFVNYFKPFDPLYSILSSSESAQGKTSSLMLGPSSTSLFGLSLITMAFGCLDEQSAFPGGWALLPTLGAALLIHSGPTAWFNQRVLSTSWAVFIGKISYALYLWHWPLLVFAKLRYPNPDFRPSYMTPLMMLVLAFAFSLSSVYHVENVLRRHKSKWVVPSLLSGMLAMSLLSAVTVVSPDSFAYSHQSLKGPRDSHLTPELLQMPNQGFQAEDPNVSRFQNVSVPSQKTIRMARLDWHPNVGLLPIPANHSLGDDSGFILNPGHEDKSLVVVFGDMHMDMLKPRFVQLAENTKPKDLPTIVFKSMSYAPLRLCTWWVDILQRKLREVRPRGVIYAINWLKHLHPGSLAMDQAHNKSKCCTDYSDACLGQSREDVKLILSQFKDDISLMTMYGIKVFVNTISPEGPAYDPTTMSNRSLSVNRTAFRQDHAWLLEQIERTIAAAKANVYDLSDNLCWDDECHVVDPNGVPVRTNSNLLTSTFAANYLSVVDHIIGEMSSSSDNWKLGEAPNTSRGPRIEEPTVSKIKEAWSCWWTDQGYSQLAHDSIYNTPPGQWGYGDRSLNLGQERLVIAVGDSHASQVKPRFLKLYNDHMAAKKTSPFPSILFKSFNGVPFLSCSPTYEPILAMIKRVRPKVVLHSMNWPQFLRPGGKDSDEIVGRPQCCRSSYRDNCDYQRPKDIPALIHQLQTDLTELTSLGIKVFVATLNPEGKQFEPNHMLSGDDVGDIRPVSKSKFRQEHKELIDLVETAVAAANATLIDYADNYCWEDVCQVVDHYGRPIFKDSDHLTSTFVYRYLSVVDQVIDAAMAD